MEGKMVDLTFPEFDVKSQMQLNGILRYMGRKTALYGGANFAKMVRKSEHLIITEVVHTAKLCGSGFFDNKMGPELR